MTSYRQLAWNKISQWFTSLTSDDEEIGWKTLGSDLDGNFYYDQAGDAVAINGDGSRIAVGSSHSNGGNGHVAVYEWDESTQNWIQLGWKIPGNYNDMAGSSLDMSSSGNSIIIGAPQHQNYYGTARVFQWNAQFHSWIKKGQDLDADERYDEGGEAVSISGDGNHVAIGAPESNGKKGYVKVYEFDDSTSTWEQLGEILYGTDYYNRKGNSLSLNYDGKRMVVGSHMYDFDVNLDGVMAGSANVWEYDESIDQWSKMGSRVVGSTDYYDLFGHSVDINHAGDRIVISAINSEPDSSNTHNTGLIQVYGFINNEWEQLGSDIYGLSSGDGLGESVSINGVGDRIVAGASYADDGAVNAGQVMVFDYNTSLDEWVQVGDTIIGECNNDRSGKAVAISDNGTRVIVGAPYNEYYTGHARVYEAIPGFVDYNNDHCFTVPQPTPTPTTKVPTTNSPTSMVPTKSPIASTQPPTELPSQSPTTLSPTSSPSDTCTSSPLEFILGDYELDCEWVADDTTVRCAYPGVASHCPNECGACETYACADAETILIHQNDEKTCAELEAYDEATINHVCAMNPDIKLTCRGTCQYCI